MSSHNPPVTSPTPHRTVSGKLVLAGTAVGCIVLFFLTWASLRSVEKRVHFDRTHLDWSNRAQWIAPAVIKTTLVKPNAANAQYTYNKPRYRDTGLAIPPEEEQAILACTDIARDQDFTSDATWLSVLQHASSFQQNNQSPHFYIQYLLATWHQLNDDTDTAAGLFQQSIDQAPKIIVIEYVTPDGKPAPDLNLGTIEIGCDRVIEEKTKLDQRLVLVYPHQKTDAVGRVYLPVYDTTYRPVTLPQPDGYNITYSHPEGWFKLPTRLGSLTATVNSD